MLGVAIQAVLTFRDLAFTSLIIVLLSLSLLLIRFHLLLASHFLFLLLFLNNIRLFSSIRGLFSTAGAGLFRHALVFIIAAVIAT